MYPTDFPRNQWYVAARSEELGRELLSRWFLGEPVCLYRKEDGTPVALVDRCIHRQMPLSDGHLHGDDVECGYHGILYGSDGKAKRIPSQEFVPPACSVKRFALVERQQIVWIWMGDPAKADEELLPDHRWLDAPGWTAVGGTLHLMGRAQLLNENLLDLSHLSFLHADSIGTSEVAEVPITTEFDDRSVRVIREMKNIASPNAFQKTMGLRERIDRTQTASFFPPGFHTTHVSAKPAGEAGDENLCQHKAIHLVTPETRTTAHYFWFHARDYAVGDDEISELWRQMSYGVFEEDIKAVEAIEKVIAAYEPSYPTELNMKVDAGPVRARRMIEEMIRKEEPEDDTPVGALASADAGVQGTASGASGPRG